MCAAPMVLDNLFSIPSMEVKEKNKEFYNAYEIYMLVQSCKNTVLKMKRMSSKKMFIEVNLLSEYHKVKSLCLWTEQRISI